MKKVLLALSGGVDSAVSAHLLQNMGYNVQGLVICFSLQHEKAVAAAQTAAKELDIPLHIAHCEDAFNEKVITPFCDDYSNGRTPSPCVFCNPLVKFATLAQKADELGIEQIASGHYARIVGTNGNYHVSMAKSIARDQSYMLYRLPQAILSRLLLPAGELSKPEIRDMAKTLGLANADAPDSQDICFIPNSDYASFILAKGYTARTGCFIAPDGENLGRHNGVLHYTVGQRRGLGVALGKPVYVSAILPSGNVQLAYDEQLYQYTAIISQLYWQSCTAVGEEGLTVKIRSVAKPAPCKLLQSTEDTVEIAFEEPQRAPAPGQHAVIYRGNIVLGGGIIKNTQLG